MEERERRNPDQETATEDGLEQQADELQRKQPKTDDDVPDITDPEEWRRAPKEGGGA